MTSESPEPRKYPFGEPDGLTVHPTYEELRGCDGMAVVQPPYGKCTYLAVRHEDVRTVLGDARFSRARSVGEDEPRVHPFVPRPDALSAMDPPEHTRLRKALTGAFTVRRMQALRPRVAQIVDDLLDQVEKQGPPADLVAAFAHPMPIMVICEVLGVPFGDRDRFANWAMMTLATASSGVSMDEIADARKQMFGYLAGLVAARRAEPANDLLSVLAEAHDEGGRLTESEMLGLASSVLVAGHETTANQIASFVYTLMVNPNRWQELRVTPDLVPRAVEELLRVAPVTATAGFSRMATEDIQVGSQLVRAGERVMPTLFSANQDPAAFPDPKAVDFHRDNIGSHVAFSYGAHHCPGSNLARMELQVALGSLVGRFPDLRLAVPADEVAWKASLLSRGPQSLPVAW
jgi:cytochrome P450